MKWNVKHIFNFTEEKAWGDGYCLGGFHDKSGRVYFQEYFKHWIGLLDSDDKFLWTAGSTDLGLSDTHIYCNLQNPHYITESPDKSTLVSCGGSNKIYKIFPKKKVAELLIDTEKMGLKDIGNCEYDFDGNIWVNEVSGCRVWQFDHEGNILQVIGRKTPGFQTKPAMFDEVRFNWIYDLRLGPDGNIYVLDSKNYSVRMIDIQNKIVTLLVGTGKPGYTGDGGDALNATLGSKPNVHFDGPYSLSLDEGGNIYIGDTQNYVLRMVDKQTNIISTIAGNHQVKPDIRNDPLEKDPLKLNFPLISSLDYYNKCLFIPDMNGDMIILEKKDEKS